MKSVDLEDLKADRYYILYEHATGTENHFGECGKVLMLIHTTEGLVDHGIDNEYFRYVIEGECLSEYLAEYANTYNQEADTCSVDIILSVKDDDNYNDGFEFSDDDPAIFWELTDSEVCVHTIGHL